MPRKARVKGLKAIHHIMVRSISEIDLFKEDKDKIKYFSLIKKYQEKYRFKVYAYCLMKNHGHLIVDCLGADISKIMHAINFCYAQYYNRKYKRHGHVFQDRFKNKLVHSDRYFIVLSGYIHNNPKDLLGYENRVEKYPFSSLNEYINRTNKYDILTTGYLWWILHIHGLSKIDKYLNLVFKSSLESEIEDAEFMDEKTNYRSEQVILPSNYDEEKLISLIAEHFKVDPLSLHFKNIREYTEFRAVVCFVMNSLLDLTQAEICGKIGNISQSRVSFLSNMGMEILNKDENLFEKILKY